jgi:hypothetical protein
MIDAKTRDRLFTVWFSDPLFRDGRQNLVASIHRHLFEMPAQVRHLPGRKPAKAPSANLIAGMDGALVYPFDHFFNTGLIHAAFDFDLP